MKVIFTDTCGYKQWLTPSKITESFISLKNYLTINTRFGKAQIFVVLVCEFCILYLDSQVK